MTVEGRTITGSEDLGAIREWDSCVRSAEASWCWLMFGDVAEVRALVTTSWDLSGRGDWGGRGGGSTLEGVLCGPSW